MLCERKIVFYNNDGWFCKATNSFGTFHGRFFCSLHYVLVRKRLKSKKIRKPKNNVFAEKGTRNTINCMKMNIKFNDSFIYTKVNNNKKTGNAFLEQNMITDWPKQKQSKIFDSNWKKSSNEEYFQKKNKRRFDQFNFIAKYEISYVHISI